MVELMTEYWKGMLADQPIDPSQSSEEWALPTLKELENKILVKVKRTPPKQKATDLKPTTLQTPAVPMQRSISNDTASSGEELPEGAPPAPKSKVTEALAKLGVFTGAYSFKGLDKPEAQIPTHVFSLSEKSLMEVHETQPAALFKHNKVSRHN